MDFGTFGRPCRCGDCGADLWRPATAAEADHLEREMGLPGAADDLIAVTYWACPVCGNTAAVLIGGFDHSAL